MDANASSDGGVPFVGRPEQPAFARRRRLRRGDDDVPDGLRARPDEEDDLEGDAGTGLARRY